MSHSATVTPGFDHFLPDPPRRRADGQWYACYRVRRDHGGRSQTTSETSDLFKTEAEAVRWYEQEARRLGLAAP